MVWLEVFMAGEHGEERSTNELIDDILSLPKAEKVTAERHLYFRGLGLSNADSMVVMRRFAIARTLSSGGVETVSLQAFTNEARAYIDDLMPGLDLALFISAMQPGNLFGSRRLQKADRFAELRIFFDRDWLPRMQLSGRTPLSPTFASEVSKSWANYGVNFSTQGHDIEIGFAPDHMQKINSALARIATDNRD